MDKTSSLPKVHKKSSHHQNLMIHINMQVDLSVILYYTPQNTALQNVLSKLARG